MTIVTSSTLASYLVHNLSWTAKLEAEVYPIAATNLCHQNYTQANGCRSWLGLWLTFHLVPPLALHYIWHPADKLLASLSLFHTALQSENGKGCFAAECYAWLHEELMVAIQWSCDACWKNMPKKVNRQAEKDWKGGFGLGGEYLLEAALLQYPLTAGPRGLK